MIIHGLNKLTLVDYPGLLAAIVFTGGCDFRCPFCQNASLVLDPSSQPILQTEEILDFLKKRKGMLDGLVVTGGEPLLNKDIDQFLSMVKEIGYKIKLDTNGSYPERLKNLVDLNLVDYVAMDVKNSLDDYGKTIGIANFDVKNIEKSVTYLKSGAVPYEFRTTVVKELHDEENIKKIGKLISPCERYFLQTFKDSGDIIGENLTSPSKETMEKYLEIVKVYVPNAEIRDQV